MQSVFSSFYFPGEYLCWKLLQKFWWIRIRATLKGEYLLSKDFLVYQEICSR